MLLFLLLLCRGHIGIGIGILVLVVIGVIDVIVIIGSLKTPCPRLLHLPQGRSVRQERVLRAVVELDDDRPFVAATVLPAAELDDRPVEPEEAMPTSTFFSLRDRLRSMR